MCIRDRPEDEPDRRFDLCRFGAILHVVLLWMKKADNECCLLLLSIDMFSGGEASDGAL